MFIRKKNFQKIQHSNNKFRNRIKELEEILCPCEQHDYVVADVETTYPFAGGQVEVMHKRKLICRKCKNIIYDFDGCGHSYKHTIDMKEEKNNESKMRL